MALPRPSDICVSIRNLRGRVADGQDNQYGTLEEAVALIDALKPDRLEWCSVTDPEAIALFKQRVPVFVATLTTGTREGETSRSCSFEGGPICPHWKLPQGTVLSRRNHICQNQPEDVQQKLDTITRYIADGITGSFQHDDWWGNAQMIDYRNPCFCDRCMAAFARFLDLDLDYREYLYRHGWRELPQLVADAQAGHVPLWEDFRRFAAQTVRNYMRTLRHHQMRLLGGEAGSMSINGSPANFGGRTRIVQDVVDYFTSETKDLAPADLHLLSNLTRETGRLQIVSLFPNRHQQQPALTDEQLHSDGFVARTNHDIALCYCLGMPVLFPYDVWMGPRLPRWFGTIAEYGDTYTIVRENPNWFSDHQPIEIIEEADRTVVIARHNDATKRGLKHVIGHDGRWVTDIASV